jgi:uncharacterized protein HemY
MVNDIENIVLDAQKHNKREELLAFVETIRLENPQKELIDLYQIAHEHIIKSQILGN